MEDIDSLIKVLEELSKCNSQEEVQMLKIRFQDPTNREANEDGEPAMKKQKREVSNATEGFGLLALDQMGKHVKNCKKEVNKLIERGKFTEGITFQAYSPLSRGDTLPVAKLAGEATTKRMMQEIWNCLMNDGVRKIGVYGMGGIGKTTVMKHINNCLLEEAKDKFDSVIWVTVSKAFDVIKLQYDISCKLGLDFSKYDDVTSRAAMICLALQAKKRCVLILDDLWEGFHLHDIGIPEPSVSNICKLVLTTRLLLVCRLMNCKVIQMELLTKEEAWNLFVNHYGNDMFLTKELKPIVEDVSKECARLPLAIVTVANGMKGVKEPYEWRDALEKLRGYSKEPDDKGRKVIEQLKFSYDRLKNKKLQECLLCCALYPEDFDIYKETLIELLIVEGIIDTKKTRQAQFDEGHVMLNNLGNACLLEDVDKFVKLHDLVRDMELQITSVAPRFMVEAGLQLKELPCEEKWSDDLTKVSLMRNNISITSRSPSPRCPRLTTLMLQNNPLDGISSSFFEHLQGLMILDLSCTDIKSLPNAISDLVNMVALLLRGCDRLAYVPSLRKLKNLRRLDLEETKIARAPDGLELLVNLRYLNLYTYSLKMIPRRTIPRLCNLHELILVFTGDTKVKMRGEELMCLKDLEIFKGVFVDINSMSTYVRHIQQAGSNLTHYIFLVGDSPCYHNRFSLNYDKCVLLQNYKIQKSRWTWKKDISLMLPKDVQLLDLQDFHDITSLCDVPSLDETIDLRMCRICCCSGMRHLVSSSTSLTRLLQCLEILDINRAENFSAFMGGDRAVPYGAFFRLHKLSISSCPNIEVLLTPEILSNLQSLETLVVTRCKEIVEIISAGSNNEAVQEGLLKVTLPKLKCLILLHLPNLKSICSSTSILVCDSINQIGLCSCPMLRRIPLDLPMNNQGQLLAPPSLSHIRIEREIWELLEWDQSNAKDVLQPLCNFNYKVF